MSLPLQGKGSRLVKTTPSRTRHLTAIRGSDSLSVAKQTREGFRTETFGGLFFCRYESFFVLRERGLRIGAASKRRVDFG